MLTIIFKKISYQSCSWVSPKLVQVPFPGTVSCLYEKSLLWFCSSYNLKNNSVRKIRVLVLFPTDSSQTKSSIEAKSYVMSYSITLWSILTYCWTSNWHFGQWSSIQDAKLHIRLKSCCWLLIFPPSLK